MSTKYHPGSSLLPSGGTAYFPVLAVSERETGKGELRQWVTSFGPKSQFTLNMEGKMKQVFLLYSPWFLFSSSQMMGYGMLIWQKNPGGISLACSLVALLLKSSLEPIGILASILVIYQLGDYWVLLMILDRIMESWHFPIEKWVKNLCHNPIDTVLLKILMLPQTTNISYPIETYRLSLIPNIICLKRLALASCYISLTKEAETFAKLSVDGVVS